MKKYIKPEILVVRLQHQGLLMQSTVSAVSTNVDLLLNPNGAGGTIIPRAPEQNNIWDEEW